MTSIALLAVTAALVWQLHQPRTLTYLRVHQGDLLEEER